MSELSTYFMQCAHRSIGQTRKDNKRPYEIHPAGVRRRTSQVTVDPRILAIADLHDVEEDVAHAKDKDGKDIRVPIPADQQEIFLLPRRAEDYFYNLESIDLTFGHFVKEGVKFLTDEFTKENYPNLNRKARKQAERERYQTFPAHVKWVKLADIAENLADDGEVLLADGGAEVGFNQMFIWEKSLCIPYLRDEGPENRFLYEQAVEVLREKAEKFKVKVDFRRI